jgi:hypothetical protein
MNKQPTPETDKAERMAYSQEYMVPTEFASKLERERDEANEELSKKYVEYDQLFDEAEKIRIELEMWRDGNIMHEIHRNELEKVERERDEAREELHDIRLNLGADAEGYTLLHAVCVLQNERDEAREKMADALQEVDLRTLDFERMKQDRDEAREALREAIQFRDTTLNGYDLDAWLKAAGLKL